VNAPQPQQPAPFSPKAQAEIDQNAFAAKTGGLVTLSAPTFWELYYSAQAWQNLAASKKYQRLHPPCPQCLGTGKNLVHPQPCASCQGTGRADQQSATAT
jgi:hypothetical protein